MDLFLIIIIVISATIIFNILTERRKEIKNEIEYADIKLKAALYDIGSVLDNTANQALLLKIARMQYLHDSIITPYIFPKKKYTKEWLEIEKDWANYCRTVASMTIDQAGVGAYYGLENEDELEQVDIRKNTKIMEGIEKKFEARHKTK